MPKRAAECVEKHACEGPLVGLLPGRLPRQFSSNRHIATPVLHSSGKQKGLRFHPAPVHPRRVPAASHSVGHRDHDRLAFVNVDHHALAIDIIHLQAAQLRAPGPELSHARVGQRT